jgi:hypothetical protein
MNRFWTTLPIAVMAAVPIWTAPSAPIVAIEATACVLCALGIFWHGIGPFTGGGCIAVTGYAVALWSGAGGVDVVGAAIFGLALLFLLDLSEFARRFRGAEIASDVMRAQTAYWLRRAAVIAGAIAVLTLGGSVLSLLFPGTGRAMIAGLGAVIAFAGALYAGILRKPGDA